MHSYKPNDLQPCLDGRRVVLAGDSMVRQVYWALLRQVNSSGTLPDPAVTEKHADIVHAVDGVNWEFYWDPYLNATWKQRSANIVTQSARPALVVIGTGSWYAKNLPTAEALERWHGTIDDVVMRAVQLPSDLFVLLPVLEPHYSRLNEARQAITPEIVSHMNGYLTSLSAAGRINVAHSYNNMLYTAPSELTHDDEGLHLVNSVTSAQAQVLLNLRCNDHLPKKFPFDSTCCFRYPAPNYIQILFYLFALIIVPILYHYKPAELVKRNYIPSEKNLYALLAFGLVIAYAYFTDRTHLFDKESKQFYLDQFWIMLILSGVLGYLTSETAEKDQPFLSRDQTDEWKGWMQILILIYHYLGASKVAWIYNVIRVLVAMYLFMTGFGHTVFFYKKADFSFQRFVGVLIRLNLLNVVLAYTMDTDYLFYYFSPLVTFWFGIIWITMWIKHENNKDLRFLGGKILGSAIVTSVITMTPGILEAVFAVLNAVARINWNAVEWRFRVSLDIWIVYFGMIVAILFIKGNEITGSPNWPQIKKFSIGASLAVIPLFFIFEATRKDKFAYNAWHPFVSVLPTLAFIVLRNASAKLRNTHSVAFAFIGRCSLETFVLQFHIWLAADTKGVLLVIPPNRWRLVSFVVATIIFIFVSWKLSVVTGTLTDWIMGSKKKPAVLPAAVPAPPPPPPAEPVEEEEKEAIEMEKVNGENGSTEPSAPAEDSLEALLPTPVVASVRQMTFSEKLTRVIGIYWDDLRVRFGIMIIGLWFLNLVCYYSLLLLTTDISITMIHIFPS